MALHPPVWVPPPPEYPECQAAAKCTNANAPHHLSETSKVWGCGNNSEGELGLGMYYMCVCLRVCVFTHTHKHTRTHKRRYRHKDTDREGKPVREPGVLCV